MSTTAANKTALRNRETVAEGTMAFHFDRPPGFEFKAGQSIDLTLNNPPETDAEGNIRTFSIVSAPFEPELMIATRMRDTAFKRVLGKSALPLEIKMEGPGGSFNLHKNPAKPAVFLTGGIGITPFFSMVKQAVHDKLPQQLYLFYSNRRPEEAPFLDRLGELARQAPNFHFIPTMTEMDKSKREWQGERGYINREMLDRYLPSLQGPIYYIAGPPQMVTAMRNMLATAGADEDDVRTEEFAGY